MHCCVKSEGCQDENEDFLLLEEGGVIRSSLKCEKNMKALVFYLQGVNTDVFYRVLAVEKKMMVPVPLVWEQSSCEMNRQ